MSTRNLNQIVSNGYNMTVREVTQNDVGITIGGTPRKFGMSRPLSTQLSNARIALGCTPLGDTDKELINGWQNSQQ